MGEDSFILISLAYMRGGGDSFILISLAYMRGGRFFYIDIISLHEGGTLLY